MLSENGDGSYLFHVMSNAQPEIFNNKSNDFVNRLSTPLTFDKTQAWEVGLKEFSYVNNVDTVVDKPGGIEHSVTIGKLYDEHNLYNYLPHYITEGGSQMKQYRIFGRRHLNLDELDVVEALKLTLQENFNEVVLRMKADYSSLFYVGSNGVDQRNDIYSFYLAPPTDYQRLSNKDARYALVFSPLLAQALQIKKCVHVTQGREPIRIVTGIAAGIPNYLFPQKSETGYTFDVEAFWLSIVPLHRCLFSTRTLRSTSLSNMNLVEFLRILEWNQLGRLSLIDDSKAAFNFDFEGLVGIDYDIFKRFMSHRNVTITIGAGQKLLFPKIGTNPVVNKTLDTDAKRITELEKLIKVAKAEVEQQRKISKELSAQQKQLQTERDKVNASLVKIYEKVRKGARYFTLEGVRYELYIEPDLKQRELHARQLDIQKRLNQTLKHFLQSQKRLVEREAKYKEMETEQLLYYNQKYSQDPPLFFKDIPHDLDVDDYLKKLGTICERNRHRDTTTSEAKAIYEKELCDLKTFAEANSCLTFFDTDQEIYIVNKATGTSVIVLRKGAYTADQIFEFLKTQVNFVLRDTDESFTYHRTLNEFGVLSFHFVASPTVAINAQGRPFSDFLSRGIYSRTEENRGGLQHNDQYRLALKCNDLHLTESYIRKYVSKIHRMIQAGDSQELTRLAKWGNTVVHVKQDMGFNIYFQDTQGASIPDNVKESMQHTLLQDVSGPLSLTVREGFYTPYSLAKALNDLLPAQNLYWFEAYNDAQHYFIKIHMMENTSIQFDHEWLKVLPTIVSTVIQHRVRNGTVLRFPTVRFRSPGGKEFPFKNVDLAQVRSSQNKRNKTFIQRFVYEMYHQEINESQTKVPHNQTKLRNNLNHGFETNEDNMFYFVTGMRIKVEHRSGKSLTKIKIPYEYEKKIIHLYSNTLSQRDSNSLMGIQGHRFLQPFHTIRVPQGQYSVSTLVESIQRQITPWNPDMEFKLEAGNFLTIKTGPSDYIDLQNIQDVFNLETDFLGPDTIYTTPVPIDLVPPSYNIIIYCNLVNESLVGGQRERILRIFPKESKRKLGESITEAMLDIDYYPLYLTEINDIHIQFFGDDGFPVPIHLGRSYVKLHIRKRLGKS